MEMTKLAGWAVLSAALAFGSATGTVDAATMSPYRATYMLSPASGVGQKQIRVSDGLMIIELSDDCDAYTMTNRTVIRASVGDGNEITLDMQSSNWESRDGLGYRVLSSGRLNGGEFLSIRGSAKLGTAGGPGVATYTAPEAKDLQLPAGTRFPIQAARYSLSEIERGARHTTYVQFDGSGVEGAYMGSDFVVDEPIEFTEPPTGDLKLLDTPSWHVRSALFDLADDGAPPVFEIDGQVHANGIASGFTIDSDLFAALATLTKIEALPDSGC